MENDLLFEWDEQKALTNIKKHKNVTFEEAATVFQDPLACLHFDEHHSDEEDREILIGHSLRGRLLLVSFTRRGTATIRIISARLADKRERKSYEEDQGL